MLDLLQIKLYYAWYKSLRYNLKQLLWSIFYCFLLSHPNMELQVWKTVKWLENCPSGVLSEHSFPCWYMTVGSFQLWAGDAHIAFRMECLLLDLSAWFKYSYFTRRKKLLTSKSGSVFFCNGPFGTLHRVNTTLELGNSLAELIFITSGAKASLGQCEERALQILIARRPWYGLYLPFYLLF